MEIRRQKSKSTSKLAYMDQQEPRRREAAAEPQPSESHLGPTEFVHPEVTLPTPTPSASDEEVLIDIFSPWPTLTVARARHLLRPKL